MKLLDRFSVARRNWEGFAATDPMWAILTSPDRRGTWDRDEFLSRGREDVEALLKLLKQSGVRVPLGRAMDFGCGLGRLTLPLSERFESVVGVDVAEGMVQGARELAKGRVNVTYIHNARPDLSRLDSAQFDFICSLITLQHVPPEVSRVYIAEFVRLLAPDGVAVFQVPSKFTGPGIKRVLRHLPQGLLTVFWRLSNRIPYYMEMNAVPRSLVEKTVEEAGGKVLCVLEDRSAGEQWESWRYVVGGAALPG